MTRRNYIALLGDFSSEHLNMGSVGEKFSWSFCQVDDVSGLTALGQHTNLMAVLIHAPTLGVPWAQALKEVRTAVPEAQPVICHGLDEMQSRNEMFDGGAYYALLSPLEATEVRQALGFAWASRRSPRTRPSPPKHASPRHAPRAMEACAGAA